MTGDVPTEQKDMTFSSKAKCQMPRYNVRQV